MDFLVTYNNQGDQIKNDGARVFTTYFSIITQLELSVAMETRVLIRSDPNLLQLFPTPMMLHIEFDYDWPAGYGNIHV